MWIFFILGLNIGYCDWINDILIPPASKTIYVATIGGVYQKEGDAFKPINNGFLNLYINCLAIDKESRVYAGCDDGLYLLKEKRWIKILDEPFVRNLLIFNKTIIVGTNVGRVLKSNDCGVSFECVLMLSSPIVAITLFNRCIYLSSSNSGLYESCDNGVHWRRLKFEGKGVRDVLVDKGVIFIASENGLLKGFPPNWQALNSGLTTKDIRVITKDKNALYLGTYIHGLFVSYNNGKRWEAENTGLSNTNINDIAIVGDTIYVATEDGLYKRKGDKGKFERENEGFVYSPLVPLSKTPEEIRKRKERLGIKPPQGEGGH